MRSEVIPLVESLHVACLECGDSITVHASATIEEIRKWGTIEEIRKWVEEHEEECG